MVAQLSYSLLVLSRLVKSDSPLMWPRVLSLQFEVKHSQVVMSWVKDRIRGLR